MAGRLSSPAQNAPFHKRKQRGRSSWKWKEALIPIDYAVNRHEQIHTGLYVRCKDLPWDAVSDSWCALQTQRAYIPVAQGSRYAACATDAENSAVQVIILTSSRYLPCIASAVKPLQGRLSSVSRVARRRLDPIWIDLAVIPVQRDRAGSSDNIRRQGISLLPSLGPWSVFVYELDARVECCVSCAG